MRPESSVTFTGPIALADIKGPAGDPNYWAEHKIGYFKKGKMTEEIFEHMTHAVEEGLRFQDELATAWDITPENMPKIALVTCKDIPTLYDFEDKNNPDFTKLTSGEGDGRVGYTSSLSYPAGMKVDYVFLCSCVHSTIPNHLKVVKHALAKLAEEGRPESREMYRLPNEW